MTEPNRVIEAGAGTGKTTRLVKAVLEALWLREIPLDALVALTFTNKAAGEMKERIGEVLFRAGNETESLEQLRLKPWWPALPRGFSSDQLRRLSRAALEVLDRADISTIHSFSFALLKRFPGPAGIDPEAVIDDKGIRFDRIFDEEWSPWIAAELAADSARRDDWLKLLAREELAGLPEIARELCDFTVPLNSLPISVDSMARQLRPKHEALRALCASHSGGQVNDRIARACEEILGAVCAEPQTAPQLSAEIRADLNGTAGKTKAWTEEDRKRLKYFQMLAKLLASQGPSSVALATALLKPFIARVRARLLAEGVLTHSALVTLARDLVKNYPAIRERLKNEIQLILIDEFQDTDPVQAELLLFLAEKPGRSATRWQEVETQPGRLFVVGDPKQSIYRFRGADIAAYQDIVEELVGQGALQETLATNYRSQSHILEGVNQAFERLMTMQPGVSPAYKPVEPKHAFNPAMPLHGFDLWLADAAEDQSTEEAQITEAEAVAEWIAEHRGRMDVSDPDGKRPLAYRDIALIFRTYSPMDIFVEALRRRDIPFAVESERFFFTTPEVTDVINLLRAAADPADELSAVGFLRGPLGGLTDTEILRLKGAGTLAEAPALAWVCGLRARLAVEPLRDVLRDLFEDTFLLELAARSYHGDQTLANLFKLRRILIDFCADGEMTLPRLFERLDRYFDDDTLEGESPLADEKFDAVRLLTIHKAKGLEFPVVFLPSLHSEISRYRSAPVQFDWRSGRVGLSLASGASNLDKLDLDEEGQRRDGAEKTRLLYVAMTRAKERLMLSGGTHLKRGRESNFLGQLAGAWGIDLENVADGSEVRIGQAAIHVRRLAQRKAPVQKREHAKPVTVSADEAESFARVWRERRARAETWRKTPAIIRPSQLTSNLTHHADQEWTDRPATEGPDRAALLGTLVHRFLEVWDFTCAKCDMPAKLREVATKFLTAEGVLEEWISLIQEAQTMLADFIGSEAYEEIASSEILGRELPFFYGTIPLVRGTIDILYRLPNGQLIVGDYKTGRLSDDTDRYAAQGRAYCEAIQRALSEKSSFKIIALRTQLAAAPSKS